MANPLQPGGDAAIQSQEKYFEKNDEPISSTREEKLGYDAYAEVLTSRIVSSKPPITVGISGSWGSGKTSLMRLIKAKLDEQGTSVKSIWVNVWQLNSQEEVWDAFVQALVSRVRQEMKWWQRIRFKVALKQLLRSSYLLALAIVPAVVGTYLSKPNATWTDVFQLLLLRGPFNAPAPMTSALLTYGLAIWAVQKPIKAAWQFDVKSILLTGSYEARITELGKLSNQFAEFVKALVGKNGRLVVFIDDLDRCSPKVIPQVLEAIKLFAATENCVYVLGIDYGAVWKSIKEGHSFPNEEDGARYLEKIIQVSFQLPALSPAAVRFYLRDLFPTRTEYLDQTLDNEVKEIFALGLESNPRALKRAVQTYYTWMDVAERGLKRWEVDPVEPELVAKWLTIQSRYPKILEFVSRRKEHLLWLERNALHKAGEAGRLSRDGARKWPPAGEPAEDAPRLEPAAEDNLEALLISGEHRFSSRAYCDTLESYIYLGGTAVGLAGDVRAQSRERSMLLSVDDGERQKFINQLLVYTGIGKYRKFYNRTAKVEAYKERLRSAADQPGVLTSDEKHLPALVEKALTEELDQDEGTLYIPPRDHVLGSASEEIARAIADGLDPELAERERARPIIYIPGFRIAQYAVDNSTFAQFVEATKDSDEVVPFGIVEYDAYCEPLFTARWETSDDPQISLPEVAGGQFKLSFESRSDGLAVRLSAADTEADNVLMPLRWRASGVLRADALIVLVTIGDAYSLERSGDAIEKSYWETTLNYEVIIKAWWDDQSIRLRRTHQEEQRYERGVGGLVDLTRLWHPVTNVSWEDAVAYCVWRRRDTGIPYRLPKEPEWEAAATRDGHSKNTYPWGDVWNPALANTKESNLDTTVKGDSFFPDGDSPFAVADMAGNVWEWCADVFGEVRDIDESGLMWDDVRFRASSDAPQQKITRSVRGGSFRETRAYARTTCRGSFEPGHTSSSVGFRVAIASEFEGLANK